MHITNLETRLAGIPTAAGRARAMLGTAWTIRADNLVDSLGGQAAVTAEFARLYDAYVKPLDIPIVPNLVEPMVDEAVKNLIIALIWSVDDEG